MSLRERAKESPHLVAAYRAARRAYRGAFSVFPLSLAVTLRLVRVHPVSRHFGLDRGTPVDRFYIERFLVQNREDIRGRVLEIRDDNYTRRFGHGVTRSDVLDLSPTNTAATIIGDLTDASTLPEAAFDCAIVTQTLQLIFDTRSAVENLARSLKPGGVLLATVPGVSSLALPLASEGRHLYQDHWRFTRFSAERLFGEFFPPDGLTVEPVGNVFSAVAFLHGLSVEEVGRRRLEVRDESCDFLVTIRAVRK